MALGVLDGGGCEVRLGATQAHVDDTGAVVGGPDDAFDDVTHPPGSVGVEHLDRHDPRARGDPGDADAVAGGGSDDAGDMGPVTVLVGGRRPVVAAVVPGVAPRDHGRPEIRMGAVDARVDHRDDHAGSVGDGPRRFRTDQIQAPLPGTHRIGRPGGAVHPMVDAHSEQSRLVLHSCDGGQGRFGAADRDCRYVQPAVGADEGHDSGTLALGDVGGQVLRIGGDRGLGLLPRRDSDRSRFGVGFSGLGRSDRCDGRDHGHGRGAQRHVASGREPRHLLRVGSPAGPVQASHGDSHPIGAPEHPGCGAHHAPEGFGIRSDRAAGHRTLGTPLGIEAITEIRGRV